MAIPRRTILCRRSSFIVYVTLGVKKDEELKINYGDGGGPADEKKMRKKKEGRL